MGNAETVRETESSSYPVLELTQVNCIYRWFKNIIYIYVFEWSQYELACLLPWILLP